ncbi:ubiquitin-specific protease UBP2 [Saccharomyces paradoxus]|uniref:Ubiquitin carboxyl-terminal hydrolase 2 n=1 Tax=Saccharomyces paradoxus TaxID=27291 RepID=A0A8B8UZS5_SACPA|nr:Ubp2 [Saccharomyces paradoxus]QHS76228.1 Ubp2 [Saccharomyces paradoxus]
MSNEDNELQNVIDDHHSQLLNQDKNNLDKNDTIIEDCPLYETSVNQQSAPVDVDDGKHLLYPDIATSLPLKTSDRLLDDILCDTIFLNSTDPKVIEKGLQTTGIIRESMLSYSTFRSSIRSNSLGSLTDQVVFQTKNEYDSISCSRYNKIYVFQAVILNPSLTEQLISSFDDIVKIPIYHLKVTVKVRQELERLKKHVGVTQFHSLDHLHEYDRVDLSTFDPSDPNLMDYGIYVSDDTNKLILIEIFKPEFNSPEEHQSFTTDAIKNRYNVMCLKNDSLDKKDTPSQADCFYTLFKIFKGPLMRKSKLEPIKTIDSGNLALNTNLNPEWLTSKYGFQASSEIDEETNEPFTEYVPPDMVGYVNDLEIRKTRESYVRKCLQLIFWGQLSTSLLAPSSPLKNTKSVKGLSSLQTSFSTSPWFHLLGESRARILLNSNEKSHSPLDAEPHFVNLSVSHYYTDRDIIRNYESLSSLDPENIGLYFDALTYIANRKGAYQLIAYCGKQDIIGQEALENALLMFKIDPKECNISELNEATLLSIYKFETSNRSQLTSNHLTNLKNALRLLAKYTKSDKLKFYVDHEPYRALSQAYDTLSIDESVDEDIIKTAYSVKINDSPGLKLDCDRALYTIAISKRSLDLFNFLTEECPQFLNYYGPEKIDYREALKLLQVNENASDETILKIFKQKWFDENVYEPDQFLILKAALTKISIERNSNLITNFLLTGTIDPNSLPPENWPTGINNIGNTCYLNSLLQYYFSIAPLRRYILEYQKTVENFNDHLSNSGHVRRIGGREISRGEVERSIQFIYQLRNLFYAMVHSRERCVTPSKELAYLAFAPSNVEVEFEVEGNKLVNGTANSSDSREEATHDVPTTIENDPSLIDLEMEYSPNGDVDKDANNTEKVESNDFEVTERDDTTGLASPTRVAKISSDQLENALEMGRQQDVTECIGNVLFQIESGSEPIRYDEDNEQYDLIKQLFYGTTKQSIVPLSATDKVRTKVERFLSLLINIGDHPKDIYDAFDSYFKDEYLTMEEYGDVKRTVAVTTFPTILQVQIQRVYYDRERLMPFKSIEPLPFKEVIYMDRYADTENTLLLAKKKETEEMKQKLKVMKSRQRELLSRDDSGLTRKDAFLESIKLLESNLVEKTPLKTEANNDVIKTLRNNVNNIDDELMSLYNNISSLEEKISHQFDDFKEYGYSLFSVFIHRGEASYGHYWIYIKDRNHNGVWRKYNDETISEVQEDEVFNFNEGNTATPYFLVYVKQGQEADIEPLKRILE